MLYFLKSIGDDVQRVIFLFQVLQDLQGFGDQLVSRRELFKIAVAQCFSEGFVGDLEIEQTQPHTFHSQFLLFDEAFSVAFPESFVMFQVLFMEAIEIIDSFRRQVE